MITRTLRTLRAVLIGLVATLAACNQGGGGTAGIDGTGAPVTSPDPSTRSTPAASNVIAYGAITAFGSIWVNGVRFDTSRASILIDGSSGTQFDLHIGDVVLLLGTVDTDTGGLIAQRIVFDSLVQGPISAIDSSGKSFVALGQRVEAGDDTWFDDKIPGRALAGLHVGDIVGVTGFRTASGAIEATRVAVKELGRREFETTGTVSDLDVVARHFKINALVVDYSAATFEAFPTGSIGEGEVVAVKGASLRDDGTLVATTIELVPPLSGKTGDRLEIEGYITSPVPMIVGGDQERVSFAVDRLPVETTSATVYVGGSRFNLWHDIRVEIEGTLRADGVLLASEIRFSYLDPVAITSRVDSVSADSFTTLGIRVKTDSLTQWLDSSSVPASPFRLASLVVSDYVSIRGIEFPAVSGEVLASAIERRDPTAETRLKGYFQSATYPSGPWRYPQPWIATLRILGVTISTNKNTLYGWEPNFGVSGATFWDDMSLGVLIEARGSRVGDRAIDATHLLYGTGP